MSDEPYKFLLPSLRVTIGTIGQSFFARFQRKRGVITEKKRVNI